MYFSQPCNALAQQLVVLLSNQLKEGGAMVAGKVQHLSDAWRAAHCWKLGDDQATSTRSKEGLGG